jgi:hypothetical protein
MKSVSISEAAAMMGSRRRPAEPVQSQSSSNDSLRCFGNWFQMVRKTGSKKYAWAMMRAGMFRI